MEDVSVIIVNLNTVGLLRACLQSIFAESLDINIEVVVIDNGSIDDSVAMVQGEFPKVRLVVNGTNEGFARPNNVGMRMASGRYFFLLNSDTVVTHGAIRALVEFMDSNPLAMACGPKLVQPDGRQQRSVTGFPTMWTHLFDMLLLDRVFPRSRVFGRGEMEFFDYSRTKEVDNVMAAAILVRRDVLETVGGFDERFAIFHNDKDWCARIRNSGRKIFYVSEVEIIHHGGQTVLLVNRDFSYFEEFWNNVMFYYQKHYGRWSVVTFKLLLVLGFSLRAGGWTLYRAIRPTPYAAMMARFSWKTLGLGLKFWAAVQPMYASRDSTTQRPKAGPKLNEG